MIAMVLGLLPIGISVFAIDEKHSEAPSRVMYMGLEMNRAGPTLLLFTWTLFIFGRMLTQVLKLYHQNLK